MTPAPSRQRSRPVRHVPNRRGDGARLREELIVAGLAMVEEEGVEALTLRAVARRVGIAATSVYLHFADLDRLRAALIERSFEELARAANEAAGGVSDPVSALRVRCRAYCRFALAHPNLYQLMFRAQLPPPPGGDPAATPGRRSFARLVAAVEACIDAGLAPKHDDPFRLASLIWTAEHGIAMARISRPTFPWTPLDTLVDEMVERMMGIPRRLGHQAAA